MSSHEKGHASSSNPTVSIAIATYQGCRFLRQQLESIQKQTLLPLEVVICDDRSDDRTRQVAHEVGQDSPFPIRFHENATKLGYADNFLRAASLCRGDLIAFCDQDDLWLEQKLSTCMEYFRDPEVQLVCHSARTLFDDVHLGFRFPDFKRLEKLRRGSCDPLENRPGFAMVLRRELLSVLPAAGRPERLYGHDHWAWFLAAFTGKVVKLPDVLSYYRQHENNVFGVSPDYPSRNFRITTETFRYLDLADAEADCSAFLLSSMNLLSEEWRRPARTMAAKLARRSWLHSSRYVIYGGKAGLFSRVKTYLRIWLSGGYLPDSSKTTLGPKAALKDLVLGVAGIRRKSELPNVSARA